MHSLARQVARRGLRAARAAGARDRRDRPGRPARGRPGGGARRRPARARVLLEDPRDLGNMGACVRVAAAADIAGVLTTGSHDPWSPDALRGAAGLHYAVPVARLGGPRGAARAGARPLLALDPDGRAARARRARPARAARLRHRAPRPQPRAAGRGRRAPQHPDARRRLEPEPRHLGRRRPVRLASRDGPLSGTRPLPLRRASRLHPVEQQPVALQRRGGAREHPLALSRGVLRLGDQLADQLGAPRGMLDVARARARGSTRSPGPPRCSRSGRSGPRPSSARSAAGRPRSRTAPRGAPAGPRRPSTPRRTPRSRARGATPRARARGRRPRARTASHSARAQPPPRRGAQAGALLAARLRSRQRRGVGERDDRVAVLARVARQLLARSARRRSSAGRTDARAR